MEYIYKAVHPEQPEMFAAVVLASAPAGEGLPLITLHGRYPRIIHGEVLTHRVKSKNGRSSRAVPIKTVLNEVRTKPFVPWHFGKNQPGMQAAENWNADVVLTDYDNEPNGFSREEAWLRQRDHAADTAEAYMNAGYHKQIPNRLLEPFSWMDTLISSTSWSNFLHLRDHKDAEPHFQDFARLVKEALTWVRDNNALQILEPGHWHLPYVTEQDWDTAYDYVMRNGLAIEENSHLKAQDLLKKISAARCARISYVPFDGNASFDRELERFQLLVNSDRLHASPTEHIATPDTSSHYDLTKVDGDDEELVKSGMMFDHPELHGNLNGWRQFRKMLPGEYVDD